jgi:hypothetical protein
MHEPRLNDALNLVLPSDYNWIGLGTFAFRESLGIVNGTGTGHLPWALVVACAVAVFMFLRHRPVATGSSRLFWILVFVFGFTCVLGEWLVIGGVRLVPLPYRAFRMIPVLENLRIPDRFVLFAVIPMVLAAAWGLEKLAQTSARRLWIVAGLMAPLFVLEARLLPVTIQTDLAPHKLPASLVEEIQSRGGATWAMPAVMANPLANAWQIQHGRPEYFGLIARVPSGLMQDRATRYPFLSWVMHERDVPWADAFATHYGSDQAVLDTQLAEFVRDSGIRSVIYTGDSRGDVERLHQVASPERWKALGVRFLAVEE